jgi:hypothetical protein
MAVKAKLAVKSNGGPSLFNGKHTESAGMEQTAVQPTQSKLAIIIQQGKVLDFIDGKTSEMRRRRNMFVRRLPSLWFANIGMRKLA